MKPIYLLTMDESAGEQKVDRFPEFSRAISTLNIYTSNFIGTVTVEASIKLNPSDNDWFVVHEEVFPEITSDNIRKRNKAINLVGRFIWMRATAEKALPYEHGLVDRVTII